MKKRTRKSVKRSGKIVDPTLFDSVHSGIIGARLAQSSMQAKGIQSLIELISGRPANPMQSPCIATHPKQIVIDKGLEGKNIYGKVIPTINVGNKTFTTDQATIHEDGSFTLNEMSRVLNCLPGQMRGSDGRCGPSGSQGIERDRMPQIKSEDVDSLLSFLSDKGVGNAKKSIPAKDLKPIQKEFNQDRVNKLNEEALKKSILVSLDNRILDGTHRWLKRYQRDKNEEVPCIRLSVNMDEALKMIKSYPKVVYAENAFCPTGPGGGVDPHCSPNILIKRNDKYTYATSFTIGDKEFTFAARSDGTASSEWDIAFWPGTLEDGGSTSMTHDKSVSAIKVLRHVQQSLHKFIEEKSPKIMSFTADKRESSRVVFYNRIAREIGEHYGYTPTGWDDRRSRYYVLSKGEMPDWLKEQREKSNVLNAFCATGAGGGIDAHCSPSSKGSGGISSFFQKAISGAKKAIAKFNSAYEKVMSLPGLRLIKKVGDWNKKLVKSYYGFLQGRYGKSQAMAIMATGQALGWGAMAGPVVGLPSVYLPMVSVWGSLPGAAVAETFLQLKRGAKAMWAAHKATFNADEGYPVLTDKQIEDEARKMAKELTRKYVDYLKDLEEEAKEKLKGMKRDRVENVFVEYDESTLCLDFSSNRVNNSECHREDRETIELLGGHISNSDNTSNQGVLDFDNMFEDNTPFSSLLEKVNNEGFYFTKDGQIVYAGGYQPKGKHHAISQVHGPRVGAADDLKGKVEGPRVGKEVDTKTAQKQVVQDKPGLGAGQGSWRTPDHEKVGMGAGQGAWRQDKPGMGAGQGSWRQSSVDSRPATRVDPKLPPPTKASLKDTIGNVLELKGLGVTDVNTLAKVLKNHTEQELTSLKDKLSKYAQGPKLEGLQAVVDKAIELSKASKEVGKNEPQRIEPTSAQPAAGAGQSGSTTGGQPGADRGGSTSPARQPTGTSKGVEGETKGPRVPATSEGGKGVSQPASGGPTKDVPGGKEGTKSGVVEPPKTETPKVEVKSGTKAETKLQTSERIPTTIQEANRRIDRFINLFDKKGMTEQANWMRKLKDHVNKVGTDEALKSLGEEVKGKGETVQYGGVAKTESGEHDISHFAKAYLNRYGINPIGMGDAPSAKGPRLISSVAPSSTKGEGIESRGEIGKKAGDVAPKLQGLRDKLHEAQNLPGLEKSEDIHKLMGKHVSRFSPEVIEKLDQTYGKGKWIVKSYGDEAYAGYGIFFPQRAQQIHENAKSTIWNSGGELAKYGFSHLRNKSGTVVGIKHENGEKYIFGTDKYDKTINGVAREWADKAAEAATHEKGTRLPRGSFMAQPAFEVVGVSDADRAAGKTHEGTGEGRTHIVTRNGKVELVPNTTWIKGEHLPVVFESAETRAMAKAAKEAIERLPLSERQGQLYAPDIVKTKDGYRVVEANPANEAGASGYLADNPFIIDAYVAHQTGREPAHVKFIRDIVSDRKPIASTKKSQEETSKWLKEATDSNKSTRTKGTGKSILKGGKRSKSNLSTNAQSIIDKELSKVYVYNGGPGSGNFGHAGRPGAIGGSGPEHGEVQPSESETEETIGTTKQDVGEATVGKFGPPKGNWKEPTELPGVNKGKLPPVKEFVPPPLPKGKAGSKAGGVSAVDGMTNTHIGDLVERVLGKGGGFKSLLPEGQRQNPLDVKYDESDQGFEIKGVSTAATEYKSAPKSEEVEAKLTYAQQYGFKPNLIVAVIDVESKTVHAYMREGEVVGSLYKGGRLNTKGFKFLGEHKFSEEDVEATRPKEKGKKKAKKG